MGSPVVGKPNLPSRRETVARAALQLLDEVGLDGLTMRRLAAELEIQNPSLYNHFTSKQELIDYMAALMIADGFADLHPPGLDQDWADWLAEYARLLRRIMLAHRDGARVLAEADVTLSDFSVGIELLLDGLQKVGFDAPIAATGVIVVTNYVLGNTFEAQADPSALHPGTDDTSSSAKRPAFDERRFPRIAALLHATDARSPAEASVIFEAGLSLILDGLRTKLAPGCTNGTSRENT
jgi:TetR/AcrR family tetracycline transcriptional repressor